MASEIERKFLPKDRKWRPAGKGDRMVQGYFFLNETATAHVRRDPHDAFSLVLKPRDHKTLVFPLPAQDGAEILKANPHYLGPRWTVRVRSSTAKGGFLTIKGPKKGISCPEYEYPLGPRQTKALLALCLETHIIKDRYNIPYKGFIWEVDVYHGHLAALNLVTIEVELPNAKAKPPLPPFVGKDITSEKAYVNARLARRLPLPFHPAPKAK